MRHETDPSHIDSGDMGGPARQEHLGEPARRASHIECPPAGHVNAKTGQTRIQFHPAPGDPGMLGRRLNPSISRNRLRALRHNLPVNPHPARCDRGLSGCPAVKQAPCQQYPVEPIAHSLIL